MDELSEEDKMTVGARPQDRALPVAAFFVAESSRRPRASSLALEDTIKGFKGLVEGQVDHLPEAAFYMVGSVDEALSRRPSVLAAEAA